MALTLIQEISLNAYSSQRYLLSESLLQESVLDKFKNTIKDIIQIGLSTGAIAISGGMGGDTIVDALFALEESEGMASAVNEIMSSGTSVGKVLKDLSGVSISQGTDAIYQKTQAAIAQAVKIAGSGAEKLLGEIKDEIQKLLTKTSRTVGKWISTLLPDDAGLGGPIVSRLISTALNQISGNVYDALSKGFNSLPGQATEFIKNPKKMEEFLNKIVSAVVDHIGHLIEPKSLGDQLQKFTTKLAGIGLTGVATMGAGALPAAIAAGLGVDTKAMMQIRNFLNTTVRQQIPNAVKTFQLILTNFFVQVATLQVVMSEDYKTAGSSPSETLDSEKEPADAQNITAGHERNFATISEIRSLVRCELLESSWDHN